MRKFFFRKNGKKKVKKGPKFFCHLRIWRTNFLIVFLFAHLGAQIFAHLARNGIPLNYLRRTYGQRYVRCEVQISAAPDA